MRISLVFLLLLLQLSFSAITALTLDGVIDQSGTTHLTVSSEFSQSEGKTVCLNISNSITQLAAKDRSGLILDSDARSEGNNTLICAVVPVDYLEFDIISDSYTSKSGPAWDFDLSIGSLENISAFNASIALPKGAVLKSTNGAVQSGESLLLSWKAGPIDTAHRAHLKAGYELPAAAPTSQDLTTISILLALGLVVVYFFLRPRPKHVPPKETAAAKAPMKAEPPEMGDSLDSNSVFLTLDETDKEIIREISRKGGKTTQAQIYLQTHMPKATLSRRLSSLENRGIIKRSQKGNRNLVTLTEVTGK